MRPDMAKVIVERPRRGGFAKEARRSKNVALENEPNNEPMKYRHNTKSPNENLRPLQRWLDKQVGRNWDKVRAELKTGIDPRNAVQQHIWEHAKDYVYETGIWYEGSIPCHAKGRAYYRARPAKAPNEISQGHLYVCPKTGILKQNGPRKHRFPELRSKGNPDFRRASPTKGYALRDEIWYELTLEELPRELERLPLAAAVPGATQPTRLELLRLSLRQSHIAVARNDVWLPYTVRLNNYRKSVGSAVDSFSPCSETFKAYHDGWVYCTKYKQMSSGQIKKAGLRK